MADFSVDLRGLDNVARIREEFPRAVALAINKTLPQMRTYGSKLVSERYNISATKVRAKSRQIIVKASPRNLVGKLITSGRPIPTIEFNVRKGGRRAPGATVSVVRGKATVVRSSFVAVMPSGHKGVFVEKKEPRRFPESGKYQLYERRPIRQLYSIGVARMMAARGAAIKMMDFAHKKFPELLSHEIARAKK